jgi:hypothetical protein
MGVETDTRKLKVGTGSTAWNSLSYIASDAPGISEIAQDAIDQALSMGSGLTKSYNDNTNTISLNIDSGIVALRSYVDDAITGLGNATAEDYVLLADVGNAGGPAKLDVDGNLLVPKSSIILEGATANAYETTLTVVDPTADRTITLPNASGTVVLSDGSGNVTVSGNLTVDGTTTTVNSTQVNIQNAFVFEGSTADAFETTLTTVEPTADRSISLPDASGTLALTSDISELAQDAVATAVTVANGLTKNYVDPNNTLELGIDYNTIATTSMVDTAVGNLEQSIQTLSGDIDDALDTKAPLNSPTFTGTVSGVTAQMVGLGHVDNTSDLNKPVSTATQTALDLKANLAGPTFTGTVVLPNTTSIGQVSDTEIGYVNGVTSAIQTQIDSKLSSADAATTYQPIVSGVSATEIGYLDGVTAAIQGQLNDKAPIASPTFTGTVSGITKSMVGLSNADNTSDANKPISTATQNALDLKQDKISGVSDTEIGYLDGVTSAIQTQINAKAPSASPTFTGTATLPSDTSIGSVSSTEIGYIDGVTSAIQTQLNSKVNLSGGTMTGALTLSGAPTSDLHAATKQYVDGIAAGINFHAPVVAATAGNLAGTYNNGTDGYLATLTKASNGSIGTIDGATVAVGNRILLRAQTDAKQNGIYVITALGDGSNPWVITRAADTDNNPAGELANGDFCFVTSGSTNGSKGFLVSTTGTITIGTTEINYAQFNASEAIVAGTNINKNGATISVVDAPTFSGAVTASSGVVFSDGTQTKEGVPSRTPIIKKTESYTLSDLGERDDLIEINSSSATTLTIPADSTLNFPIGTSMDILQTSTGQITIAGANGVTVNATPGLNLRTQWSSATLFKRAANTWVVYGDLTA